MKIMNAKELIEDNSLTNIEFAGGQTVVFTEIAMTAINLAREEGANNLIEQASANGQKKHQQGMDFMKSKAIAAFKKNCPCWSRFQQDRKCDECAYLKDFCNQLD